MTPQEAATHIAQLHRAVAQHTEVSARMAEQLAAQREELEELRHFAEWTLEFIEASGMAEQFRSYMKRRAASLIFADYHE